MNPCKYAIAICSIGAVGLITSETPIEYVYDDGSTGLAWTGIQLKNDILTLPNGKVVIVKPGDPWSSRNPKVIDHLDRIVYFGLTDKE